MEMQIIVFIVFVVVLLIVAFIGIKFVIKGIQEEIYYNKKIVKFIPM